jgi:hypothetical protein
MRRCAGEMLKVFEASLIPGAHLGEWHRQMIPHIDKGIDVMLPLMRQLKMFKQLSGCCMDGRHKDRLANFFLCVPEAFLSALQCKMVSLDSIKRLTLTISDGGLVSSTQCVGMAMSHAAEWVFEETKIPVLELPESQAHLAHILSTPGVFVGRIEVSEEGFLCQHAVMILTLSVAQTLRTKMEVDSVVLAELRDGHKTPRFLREADVDCQETVNAFLTGDYSLPGVFREVWVVGDAPIAPGTLSMYPYLCICIFVPKI